MNSAHCRRPHRRGFVASRVMAALCGVLTAIAFTTTAYPSCLTR